MRHKPRPTHLGLGHCSPNKQVEDKTRHARRRTIKDQKPDPQKPPKSTLAELTAYVVATTAFLHEVRELIILSMTLIL